MQELYLEDYDVNLQFPDEMSEDRIMEIIQRDYPEPDEKLVARFENPDTPASSLTREDFSRYKAAKPEIGLSDLPGIAVEAAAMTASRIIENLPAAVATYANVFDPGTSARTFMEGAARGLFDTETLLKMGNNYLSSKLESFGGTSENEMDDEFRRFLDVKEMQNIRGAIERGEQGAWNEYAEFAGLEAAKIDLAKVDQKAAEMTGEIIDPTLIIPAGKLGGAASRAMARVASKPVRMAGRGAEIAAGYGREAIERGKDAVRGLTEAVDDATAGLGNVVVPGGIAAAVTSGIVGGGTAGTVGAVVFAPTILDVSGGLLRGFGEAMAHTPTRLGGLGRLALHQPDTVAGKMAGKLKFLDTPIEYAGRAAGGAAIGAGFGGAIGLASGGLEGLAAGIGSGGVLGMAGGGLGRAVEGLTGSALRRAQDKDFERWVESKSPEDRARLESLSRDARIARMDAEQILLQSSVEVRHVDPDFVVDDNGTQMGQSSGMMRVEAGKPVVFLNTNADIRTMLHETLHALGRLDGFDTLISNVKNTFQRMYSDEEMNAFIRNYEDKLGREISLSSRQIEKFRGAKDAKIDYILEELAAEYFANYIKGKNSNYIFSGNNFSESLKGIFSRFTKGKLDRVYDAFQSPLFENQIKQSRQLDRAMRDLVRARKKAGRDVEASIDEPVKVYSDADLADDATFAELEAMGVAKTDSKGKRFIMKDAEQKRVAKERATTIGGILDNVSDPEGGLIKQPDGSYKGTRFSAGQLKALLDSPLINDTIKEALRQLDKISRSDQYVNMTYGAATMKTKLGKTKARNLPISNRNGLIYDIIISPLTGTMAGRVLDMSVTETRASRLYRQSPEMQQLFGSEANMFADLHTYINALTAGEKRTAEVLGSQRKSDFLNKILAIRNVKGNPEIPQVELTPRQRRLAEGRQDHPWRSFRLDRLVAMQQKEGRPILSFSEAAYQRGQTHFQPSPDSVSISSKPYTPAINGGVTREPGIIRFIPAYHGTPHKFDEFSLSKIGTGEGASAFGYGLYFTETRRVAEQYRDTLTPDLVVNGEMMPTYSRVYGDPLGADVHVMIRNYFQSLKGGYSSRDRLDSMKLDIQRKLRDIKERRGDLGPNLQELDDFFYRNVQAGKSDIEVPTGFLYEVDFDVDDASLLRWDDNYDSQPDQVKEAIDRIGDSVGVTRENYTQILQENERLAEAASQLEGFDTPEQAAFEDYYGSAKYKVARLFKEIHSTWFDGSPMRRNLTGEKIYAMLESGDILTSDRQRNASNSLKSFGVKGIKYKDGVSRRARGDDQPAFNYVAFDGSDIKIKYRNGFEVNMAAKKEPVVDTPEYRFSPEPDTIPEVRRQMQEPIESGTPMNGVFTLTPDVIARFSPATNDPGVNLEQLNGKKVFFMFADRMMVGEYVTRSGRVFKLRGGPDHPDLADNQGKIAWAVEGGPIASRLDKAIRMTDGIGVVVLQDELAVASNKDYSEIMMEELRYDLQNNPAIKKDLKKLLGDLSAAIQKTFKTNRLSKEARDRKAAEKAGKKFTAPKPKKWESIEIASLKDLEDVFPTMPFEVRKIMWQKFASKKYKNKYGGIFWQDVAQNISAYRDKDGYRTGDIVKVIQFDKSGPTSIVDPKDMGLPVHPSYRYGVLGKSISNIRGRLSVFDLLRKQLENPVDPVTGEPKIHQRVTREGDVGKAAFRALSMRSLTAPELQPTITPGILDPRTHKKPVKQKYDSSIGAARVEAMKKAREEANKFSPAGERMGALPTGEGPVLQRVDTPILTGPASNVISTERIRQEISEDKKALVFENTAVDNGKMVGLRLDIPTYERTMEAGSPVFPISVHEKWAGKAGGRAGKRIGYTNIATVENPVFMINEKAAEGIKDGKQKTTIATVEGSYRKTTRIPDDIESWTQVAMNPRRHSYYYDRATGQPVVGGDVAISTGNTVFVKNPVFASIDQFRFSPQRSLNNRGGAVYTTAEGHRAVQTSSRAGVRVYGPTGRRIGPVFGSVEEAERFLNR